jgi:hypothetical protein
MYYASQDAELVHAALISVVLALCRGQIFVVAPSHLIFISSSSAEKFEAYLKNP